MNTKDEDIKLFLTLNSINNISKVKRMKNGISNKVYKIEASEKNYLFKEYVGNFNKKCKSELLKHCEEHEINIPVLKNYITLNQRVFYLYDFIDGRHKYKLNERNLNLFVDILLKIDIEINIEEYLEDNIYVKTNQYVKDLERISNYKIDDKIVLDLINQYKSLNMDMLCLRYYLVHGDLSYTNLIWQGQKLFIIDFDEAIVAPKEYEIISAIVKMNFSNNNFDILNAKRLLNVYLDKCPCDLKTLELIWKFYILKVIIEKVALFQNGIINILNKRQQKDSWKIWYELYKNEEIVSQLFES